MKKRVWIILLAVLLVVSLIPIPVSMSDGGSTGWHALLWQYTDCHEFTQGEDGQIGYLVGPRVELLGFLPIYDGTHVEFPAG